MLIRLSNRAFLSSFWTLKHKFFLTVVPSNTFKWQVSSWKFFSLIWIISKYIVLGIQVYIMGAVGLGPLLVLTTIASVLLLTLNVSQVEAMRRFQSTKERSKSTYWTLLQEGLEIILHNADAELTVVRTPFYLIVSRFTTYSFKALTWFVDLHILLARIG